MLDEPRRERMLNVPAIVVALLVVLALVHVLLTYVLTQAQTTEFLLLFAFIPARYDASVLPDIVWPGGWAADIWTFVTYAFIHADLSHLTFNAVWFLAFGSPVAERFGPLRFSAFMAATAAAGAAVHLVTHFGELLPMVGASAAISGAMAAAMRFAFQRGGPLGMWRDREAACRVPAAPLAASLRDPRVLAFLLVWFGVNILFGVFSIGVGQRRSGDRLAGPHRWIRGGSCCVRDVRPGSRWRPRTTVTKVRADVPYSLTRAAATPACAQCAPFGVGDGNRSSYTHLSAVLGRGRLRHDNAEPPALAMHK
jgi:membrane associated rhomboid family serine protease